MTQDEVKVGRRGTRVTSIDVARKAGVSQSAVSRAFAPGPNQSGVSAATRRRIMAAAETLGYQPNAMARSLITNRSRIIGVLFSYLDNPFYAIALERLCLALQAQGYHALVFMVPRTDEGVGTVISELIGYQADGIVTASVELSSELCARCAAKGIPVVMFNRILDIPGISSVATDNVKGGRMAARHLIETGHRRIALLAGWEKASTNRDREFGFCAELAAHGMGLFARAVGHFDLQATTTATRALFDRPRSERPDAVFVANDYMAMRALSVLRFELGLDVPGDVSVIGFDDTPMAAMPEFALTTLAQPLEGMIASAIRLLLDRIATPDAPIENLALAPELKIRGSVRGA